MRHIVLCEDMPSHAESLLAHIREIDPAAAPVHCPTAGSFLSYLQSHQAPDLILMDIELNGDNGIALIQESLSADAYTQVIYVTSHLEYCTKAYETAHVGFLAKPVDPEALRLAWARAEENRRELERASLVLQSGGQVLRLRLHRILYIESRGKKLAVYTRSDSHEVYGRLNDVFTQLDGRFLRCHQSILVNLDHISVMERDCFVLEDHTVVPISQRRYSQVKQAYLSYLARTM